MLVNRAADGRIETFDGLTFHGGDGSTVEMRVFGRNRLIENLKDAGFETVEVTSEPIEEMGIMIDAHCSFPMVARKGGEGGTAGTGWENLPYTQTECGSWLRMPGANRLNWRQCWRPGTTTCGGWMSSWWNARSGCKGWRKSASPRDP